MKKVAKEKVVIGPQLHNEGVGFWGCRGTRFSIDLKLVSAIDGTVLETGSAEVVYPPFKARNVPQFVMQTGAAVVLRNTESDDLKKSVSAAIELGIRLPSWF